MTQTLPTRDGRLRWRVQWPASWSEVPARSLFREHKVRASADEVQLTPSQSHGVRPQAEYMRLTGNRVVLALAEDAAMRRVSRNDFIIHLRSFQGGIEWSGVAGKVTAAYTVIRPTADAVPSYYRWLLKSSPYIQLLRVTTNQLRDGQSIRYADFKRVPLPQPPLDEQRAIADYLDRETARIDDLVAKQERLIETLRERRRVTILEATQGGMRANVAEVATGLSWFPFAPSHWVVMPARAFLKRTKRAVGAEAEQYRLLSLTQRGVIPRDMESGAGKWPSSFDDYQIVAPGDLVFCLFDIDETPRTVGLVHEPGMLTGAYTRFVVHLDRAIPEYLAWAYAAIDDEKRFRPLYSGLRKSIRPPAFLSVRLPVPPLDEQHEIVAYLDEQTAKIDSLISKTQRFIELSKERRAALITAAVTGQIDVREAA